jgi:phage N-6-adenine-methyltransferase
MATELVAARLADCEAVIERGLATFIEVGHALLEIRDSRLYRETYCTFEDYCRERWGFSRPRAYELMHAAEVVSAIADTQGPRNEAVARELAPLRKEPEQLRETWAEAIEQHGPQPTAAQVREVVEERRNGKLDVHFSSATDEWATPQDLFDVLNAEFGFTLDVCALDSSAKCERYFTPEIDGLAQEWTGACWMNPPYGEEIGRWVAKAHEASRHGATVVCLVPARTDTGWWWEHCWEGEVRFLRGRLRFGEATSSAPFPSAVVIFGVAPQVIPWEWR